jgi:hypothetical protein
MRAFVAIAFFSIALPAAAGGRIIPNPSGNQNPYGAGAFNSNFRPAGSTPAHTPDWRVFQPSWRGGFLTYPNAPARIVVPAVPVVPYGYGYYPPYGSTYYGFQPTEQEQEAAQQPQAPPQVIVFQGPSAQPAPAPMPAPAPQVVVVQVPVPVPAPPPEPVVQARPEPAKPSGPPKEVFRWTDNDGVVHYSTQVPAGVKADKVGPK